MLSINAVFLATLAVLLVNANDQIQEGQTVLALRRKVRIQPSAEIDKPTLSLSTTINVVNVTAAETATPVEQQNNEEATAETETIHRIVGGRPVSISEVPWQAALIQDGSLVCGASIISTIWVLTAGHCVYGFGNSTFIVRAGTETFRTGGQSRRVGFTAVHGQYNRNSFSNDIAMLKVTRRFTFNQNVQPIGVPSANARIPSAFVVSGWGTTSASSTGLTRRLRGVILNRVNRRTCTRNYANTQYTISANMICAAASGRDSCQGDSGGGLVNGGMVYGIVSFGIGCADASYPSINTNVPYLSPWILNVAGLFSRRRNLDFQDADNELGINIVMV